jgi:hypothetical protein
MVGAVEAIADRDWNKALVNGAQAAGDGSCFRQAI